MKTLRNVLILILAFCLLCGCAGGPETAGNAGTPADESDYPVKSVKIDGEDISAFHILYNEEDGPSVRKGAEELQKYIRIVCGAELPLTTDPSAEGKRIAVAVTDEDTENYSYKSDENGVTISGGRTRGALYGAYGFIENCLGVRFLTSDQDYIFPSDGIELNTLDYSYEQYFEFRDVDWYECVQTELSAKRMQNSSAYIRRMTEEYGGSITYSNYLVHTISDLAELDSLDHNPCFCDEEVYQTVLKNVMKYLSWDPNPRLISVSQMDKADWCDCAECKKVLREEKSYMGALLRFVNRIAEEVEKTYPDVLVQTIAYNDSIRVPKITVPRDNVIIEACIIGECLNHSLPDEDCGRNDQMYSNLVKWNEICDRIYVWDYNTDFHYFLTPVANFDALYENIRFYHEHGVKGIFTQADPLSPSGEFGELRGYLTARLIQNPYMTREEYEEEIDTFLKGYYGSAWEIARRYFDFVNEAGKAAGDASIYARPNEVLDVNMFLDRYDEITAWFEEAREKADSETIISRLERLQLSADFMYYGALYDEKSNAGDEAGVAAMTDTLREFSNRILDCGVMFAESLKHHNPAPDEEIVTGPFDW